MGVLDRFEKGIERVVNGAFAKAFRSEVQPVEIASALRRECDEHTAVVGRDRTVVPNVFVVQLGPADHARLEQWADALADELGAAVRDHAQAQRYGFVGPVQISFEEADDLDTGLFRVSSTAVRGAEPTPGPRAPQPPAGQSPVTQTPVGSAPASRPAVVPAAPGTAWLDVAGRRYDLTAGTTVIGRGTDADVVIDDTGASRRHAEVQLAGGRAQLLDLGSTNGTFLNGERVTAAELYDGSVITIGRTQLRFRQ